MKTVKKYLEKLKRIKREAYHPLIYKIKKEYKISRRTLFYVKEYGPRANVLKTILKESAKILLLASIISSFGGLAMEHIKPLLVSVFPLIILLPTLNDMVGDYGTVVSSRFATMLHGGIIRRKWWANKELRKLFAQIAFIAMLTALLSSAVALAISSFLNHAIDVKTASKVFFVVVLDVALLVSILFLISVLAGLYIYRRREDPNNFLIPITTALADFGNMIILSILIILIT